MLTKTLSEQRDDVFVNCSVCRTTERPLHSNKISFNAVFSDFNSHVQVAFIFIKELGTPPILHMIDRATSLSDTVLMMSRSMPDAASMIKTR